MNMGWREYQDRVARFFEQLGYFAVVDATVRGARGVHRIDVLLTPRKGIVAHMWLVECKYWNTRIPKEKLLAFQQIVNDIGADRGFLMTTIGFQKGAIEAAKHSNITLTTLDELLQNVEQAWLQWPKNYELDLYEASFEAAEDNGMGPETKLYLRKRDGQPVRLPLTCLVAHSDGRVWRYELCKYDLKDGVASVCIPFHFGGQPPRGSDYRVAWRTSDGPIFTSTYVDTSK